MVEPVHGVVVELGSHEVMVMIGKKPVAVSVKVAVAVAVACSLTVTVLGTVVAYVVTVEVVT